MTWLHSCLHYSKLNTGFMHIMSVLLYACTVETTIQIYDSLGSVLIQIKEEKAGMSVLPCSVATVMRSWCSCLVGLLSEMSHEP